MVTDPEDAVDAAAREWEEMQRLDQLDGGLDDVGAHSKQPDKGKQPRSENAPATDELEAMRELEEEGAGGGNGGRTHNGETSMACPWVLSLTNL